MSNKEIGLLIKYRNNEERITKRIKPFPYFDCKFKFLVTRSEENSLEKRSLLVTKLIPAIANETFS